MSNTYNCIYIYAKKLNNKTGCVKVNTLFVSTVPWSKFCQSKLTTVYQRYEATAISIRKGLFKCTLVVRQSKKPTSIYGFWVLMCRRNQS